VTSPAIHPGRYLRPVASFLVSFVLAYGLLLAVWESRVAQAAAAVVFILAGFALYLRHRHVGRTTRTVLRRAGL
jgi:uncharacterized membrane protein